MLCFVLLGPWRPALFLPWDPGWLECGMRAGSARHPPRPQKGRLCPGGNLWAPGWLLGCGSAPALVALLWPQVSKAQLQLLPLLLLNGVFCPRILSRGLPKNTLGTAWGLFQVADLPCSERGNAGNIVPIPESPAGGHPHPPCTPQGGPHGLRVTEEKTNEYWGSGGGGGLPKAHSLWWQR